MTSYLRLLFSAALLAVATPAMAAIPQLNAECPTNIEVHADEGGPIYINGVEATLKVFNSNYYEAKHGDVTISLTINPDGTPDLSYTRRHSGNGVCTLVEY